MKNVAGALLELVNGLVAPTTGRYGPVALVDDSKLNEALVQVTNTFVPTSATRTGIGLTAPFVLISENFVTSKVNAEPAPPASTPVIDEAKAGSVLPAVSKSRSKNATLNV